MAFAVIATAAAAAPPLWKVQSGQRTIYLFGTIDLLPPGTDWGFPELTAALSDSQMLLMVDDPNKESPKYESYLYTHLSGEMLSDMLHPLDFVKLQFIAEHLGYRMPALNRVRPWFAGELVKSAAIEKAGFEWAANPQSPDREGRMPTDGFENYIEVIEAFAAMPRAGEIEILSRVIRNLTKSVESHREFAGAWLEGDEIGLERSNATERGFFGPVGWDVMVARRSATWARRLVAILRGDGAFDRVFVAVPSRHLFGADGIKARLAAAGFAVERVPETAAR
ncbi:TraB/GumN family protein [Methylobrevis albus]|uniref:TraB/GumN family protein n=1 Tax=Methylobrevis albus TaxID=2793297 RepID=A0A931MXE0_9HYPH|nr:TraB/GumN family protein [Methylobrevis albus]MBH0236710.1 TraB/GumN family protein [Methylobrevis albus]